MAEIRLSKLIKQFNIGLNTLVDFLNSQGADILPIEVTPNWKVSDKYLPALHERFGKDKNLNDAAEKVDVTMHAILDKVTSKRENNAESSALEPTAENKTTFPVIKTPVIRTKKKPVDTEGHDFGDGTSTAIVTSISFPSRVITSPIGDYECGILFSENITCFGAPVPNAWLKVHARDFFEVGAEIRVSVKSAIKEGRVAMLELPLEKSASFSKFIGETKYYFETLAPGFRLEAAYPVAETADYYIIGIQDTLLLGVVLKESIPQEAIQEDGSFPVYVAAKGESPLDLILCYYQTANLQKEEAINADEAVSNFLSEQELNIIDELDLAIVKQVLEKYPQVTRENCDQFTGEIYCRVPGDSAMNVYMNQGYFKERSFWMNVVHFPGQENTSPTIVLFNENPTVVIEMEKKNPNEFLLKNFDPRETNDAKRTIIRNNKKGSLLKISSDHLHFVTPYEPIPADYSTDDALDLGEKLGDFNGRIMETIRRTQRERISSNAQDYETLTDYLEYQCEKEEDQEADSVFIPSSQIELSTGDAIGGTGALNLDLTPDILEELIPEGEDSIDGMHVSITDETCSRELMTGVLRSDGIDTRLVFDRGRLNPQELIEGGLHIKPRVNTKHLKIQIGALNKFVMQNSLGIYHQLISGSLKPINLKEKEDVTFFNPVFTTLAKDNNQPLAVRKALANENILLIQGPPGTGKTTIIVEIIRQLAARGQKVLVCSQAHAAVQNIYDRLPSEGISIVNLDDPDSLNKLAREFNTEMYGRFLQNNVALVRRFAEDGGTIDGARELVETFSYETKEQDKRYREMHRAVLAILERGDYSVGRLNAILHNLEQETRDLTAEMLEARLFQARDVVMGTCMGVGMNRALSRGSVRFDTVIIDEAGKANLAETIVPMQLGTRFILVGDHRQLPPFIDRNEIGEYVADTMENVPVPVDANQVIHALSNSLFSDFFNHPNFPEENKVMLNYQFRMNPEIGQYISDLFYGGELFSGKGTENQTLEMADFPNAVTFINTDTKKFDRDNNPSETEAPDGSIYNAYESKIICEDILPAVKQAMGSHPELKLGIITPYKAQYFNIRRELEGSGLEGCVHTVDSIQGSEFDIVVFSFVRSFPRSKRKTVGFLDDMRRLNVSLSRAKKKLILVGNLQTLCNPDAHVNYEVEGMVSPVEVFESIARNVVSFRKASDVERFISANPEPGTIFRGCPFSLTENGDFVSFDIDLTGNRLRFSMPVWGSRPQGETLDVVYLGLGKDNGKPLFGSADFEDFCERHKVGDSLEGTVVKIVTRPSRVEGKEDKEDKIYVIDVDGLNGTMLIPSESSFSAKEGDKVDVEVKEIDPSKRKVFLNPAMTMADKIFERRFFLFSASVLSLGTNPYVTLQMEDGSLAEVQSHILYCIAEEGKLYKLFALPSGTVILDKTPYEQFRKYHHENEFVQGTVIGSDRKSYFIEAEDAVGILLKNYTFGHTLKKGDKRYFQVHSFNDEKSMIFFGL